MRHASRLALAVCTALGLGAGAAALAEERTSPYGISASNTPAIGTQAQTEPEQRPNLTLIVTQPSLVFSDGRWYTYSDGNWYRLEGQNWHHLTEANTSSSNGGGYEAPIRTSESPAAATGDDGVWYVWVPSAADATQAAADPVSFTMPVEYEFVTDNVATPAYTDAYGQWYIMVPMASDELATTFVYLY